MPSTFTANLGLEKPATGEQAGTWGNTANTDYDFLDTAIEGSQSIAISGAFTLNTAPGAVSQGRTKVITWTGTLAAAATVTITPNTAQKLYFMTNATTGGFAIIFAQGSGPTFTLQPGQSAILYCNGAGLGAGVQGANANPQFGSVVAQNLTVQGALGVASLSVTGALTAASSTISGAITAGGLITGSELALTRNDATGPAINASGAANPPLRFVAGGAEAMRILGAGNVAIGIAAPDALNRLQVQGNIAVPAGNGVFVNVTRASGMLDAASAGGLNFRTGGVDSRMVILSSGLVGIGTVSPSVPFQVIGRSRFGDANEAYAVYLGFSGAVNGVFLGSDSAGSFQLSSIGGSALLTCTQAGNVNVVAGRLGVNQPSPTVSLDVAGLIRSSSGGFRFPDGTTQVTAAVTSGGGVVSQLVVTGSRSLNTAFLNSSGRSICVSACVHATGVPWSVTAFADAGNPPFTQTAVFNPGTAPADFTIQFWVVNNAWYRVASSGPVSLVQWTEWS